MTPFSARTIILCLITPFVFLTHFAHGDTRTIPSEPLHETRCDPPRRIIVQYFSIFDGQDQFDNVLNLNPPFDKLNRLYIPFVEIDDDGELTCADNNCDLLDRLVETVLHENPCAQILATSGTDAGPFTTAAKDTEKFAESVVVFLDKHNLDGYDMDWENNIDRDDLNAILEALYNRFKNTEKEYILTLAVWPSPDKNYDLPTIGKYVDQINIMSYGVEDDLKSDVDAYSDGGIDKHQIIGGIDTESTTNKGGDTLGADGSIVEKCNVARDSGLAGMMAWRLDNDYAYENPDHLPLFSGAEELYNCMIKPSITFSKLDGYQVDTSGFVGGESWQDLSDSAKTYAFVQDADGRIVGGVAALKAGDVVDSFTWNSNSNVLLVQFGEGSNSVYNLSATDDDEKYSIVCKSPVVCQITMDDFSDKLEVKVAGGPARKIVERP